jgi:hypothetical protein
MRSRVLGILTLFSLLLFVAVVGMWVRSYWFCGHVHRGTPLVATDEGERVTYQTMSCYRGLGMYSRLEVFGPTGAIHHTTPVGWGGVWAVPEDSRLLSRGTTRGFRFLSERRRVPGASPIAYHDVFVLVMPLWLPVLLLAVPPALWTAGFVRRRRRGVAGLCVECGYDLRATPGRCPECGASAGVGRTMAAGDEGTGTRLA